LQDGLELSAIRVFVAVARTASFSQGAISVGLTRSAAGKALARLEDHLAVRLLHRTTRSVSLTSDGEAFYERCRQILADLQEAEAEICQDRPEPKGLLRLTIPDAFGRRHVLPILNAFLKACPNLTAEVSVTDRITDVAEEGYDLAIRCGGRLSDTRLIARVIARSRAVLCASPDYLALCGEPLTADDVQRHSRLTLGKRGGTRPWLLMPPGGDPLSITDAGRVSLDSGEALRQAAVAGLGITYLPSFLVGPDIAAGLLCAILADHATEQVIFHALYPSRRHLSSKVRLFVDRLAAELGDL
jgi:DNA-binding transcriptional LysR family regulator